MSKIPYKARLWISFGLFAWAIVAFVASIIYYVNTLELWIIIAIPVLAFISFILSIVFFPRFKNDGVVVSIPGLGRFPEKEMETHSNILAWEISRSEEHSGLESVGLQRVRHD